MATDHTIRRRGLPPGRLNKAARHGARRLLLVSAILLAPFALASAQPAPPPAPGQGYADPDEAPVVRPAVADVEPVWARPAIDTVATIRQRGRLRVGVVANPPFVTRSASGELMGYSIDLGQQLAADLGVTAEFVPTSWSQVVPDLLTRQFDVIASGLWLTPARALVINFTNPSSMGAMHLVANKTLAGAMKTRQDFDRPDVRIVVSAGTSQEGVVARLFPRATLVKVEGDADPLAPVLDGKAHALVVTTPSPQLVVTQTGDRLFLPLDTPLEITSSALGIRKGDPDFLNFLNSWLIFRAEDGWLQERQDHWFRKTDWVKAQ